MSKALKIILSLIVVAIAVVLLLPFWMGHQAKAALMHSFAVTEKHQPNVSFKLLSYQHGWLQSHAKVMAQIKLGATLRSSNKGLGKLLSKHHTLDFPIDYTITNGPFIKPSAGSSSWQFAKARYVTKVHYPDWLKQVVGQAVFAKLPAIHSTHLLSFNGKINGTLQIAPVTFNIENQSHTWQGATFQYDGDDSFMHLNTIGQIAGINIHQQGGKLFVSPLKLTYKQEFAPKYRFISRAKQLQLNLPEVKFSVAKTSQRALIEGIYEKVWQTLSDDNKVAAGVEFGLKQVQTTPPGKSFGPLKVQLHMSGIDAQALERLSEKYYKTFFSDQNLTNAQIQAKLMQLIQPALDLVSGGFSINLKTFDLKTPMGRIHATAKASLPPIPKASQPKGLMGMAGLAMLAQAEAHLSVPKAIVHLFLTMQAYKTITKQQQQHRLPATSGQAAADTTSPATTTPQQLTPQQIAVQAQQRAEHQLNTLTQQGLIEESADNYQVDLSYQGGKVRVNGKTLNIPMH